MPPSTCSIVPVVEAASGEAREATAERHLLRGHQPAHRLPLPQCLGSRLGIVGSGEQPPTQGVSAVPGATAFTRMPSATWSAAIA